MEVGGCSEKCDLEKPSQPQTIPEECETSIQKDFDFVERPSEDFFCPVTLDLLLNPHQTMCCGNHLSEKAVSRLQRDSKPCPMCKEPQLTTVRDKFHGRRVSAIQVRCPRTPAGCEWVGEVGGVNQHTASCPKRSWKCQYCEFTSTYDVEREHIEQCTKHPVPCPNKCEVGTVPRCDIEKHCTECPLEPVPCEFADVGCNIKVARQDLSRHMEESQQQHLLSATLLNLRLTKAAIAEKDHQLAEKDRLIAEKDKVIAEKEKDTAKVIAEKNKIIAEKDSQLLELQTEFKKFRQEFMESTKVDLDRFLLGFTHHQFLLRKFSECQKIGLCGNWFSKPFHSHPGGYKLKFTVETRQLRVFGPDMQVRLQLQGSNHELDFPVTFIVILKLMNQVSDQDHYLKTLEMNFGDASSDRAYSNCSGYIAFEDLHKKGKTTQYLKDDCLKFCMWIKTK